MKIHLTEKQFTQLYKKLNESGEITVPYQSNGNGFNTSDAQKQIQATKQKTGNAVDVNLQVSPKDIGMVSEEDNNYEGNDLDFKNIKMQADDIVYKFNKESKAFGWRDVAKEMGFRMETFNYDDMELLKSAIEDAMMDYDNEYGIPLFEGKSYTKKQINEAKIKTMKANSVCFKKKDVLKESYPFDDEYDNQEILVKIEGEDYPESMTPSEFGNWKNNVARPQGIHFKAYYAYEGEPRECFMKM